MSSGISNQMAVNANLTHQIKQINENLLGNFVDYNLKL